MNNPTTGCVSDQLDQTLILSAYGVECDTSARQDLWHSDDDDAKEAELEQDIEDLLSFNYVNNDDDYKNL